MPKSEGVKTRFRVTSGHRSSMPMLPIDSHGVTSYSCSVVADGCRVINKPPKSADCNCWQEEREQQRCEVSTEPLSSNVTQLKVDRNAKNYFRTKIILTWAWLRRMNELIWTYLNLTARVLHTIPEGRRIRERQRKKVERQCEGRSYVDNWAAV